ncbi:MAG: hypothetical protein U5J83_05005 [Bryobacterales bacterium]|nr:hypothetical protein [Bryobacterales bacterium]
MARLVILSRAIGHLLNSIVATNTVSGDARSANLTPTQEAVGILIDRFGEGKTASVIVAGNDLAAFTADIQTAVDDNGLSGTIQRNAMGPATIAGVLCSGKENRFINNHFVGAYPGWRCFWSGLFRVPCTR